MRLGIDIGGTKTAALVLDDAGDIAVELSTPSGQGNTEVIAQAVAVADRAVAIVGGWERIDGLGVCMPGLVDPHTGWAAHAVNLAVTSLDLAGDIERATGRRPVVDNDVKAAALGAHHAVRPRVTEQRSAYLNVGTGLAAAIVHDGRVVRGVGGAVGEIGHLPMGTGIPCSCGQDGCLETIASGAGLRRMWSRPAAELFPAAAAGEARALEVVSTIAHGIVLAVQALVVTGSEVVVVGGGLTRDRVELEVALAAAIGVRAQASPFLQRLDLGSRIRLLDGNLPVAALGAALLSGSHEPVGATT